MPGFHSSCKFWEPRFFVGKWWTWWWFIASWQSILIDSICVFIYIIWYGIIWYIHISDITHIHVKHHESHVSHETLWKFKKTCPGIRSCCEVSSQTVLLRSSTTVVGRNTVEKNFLEFDFLLEDCMIFPLKYDWDVVAKASQPLTLLLRICHLKLPFRCF